jgi:type IV pilus assembly protein PilM
MFLRKRRAIGLDIGSANLKVALINGTKSGYELALFDIMPLEYGIISDGIINDREKLIFYIDELSKKLKISGSDTVIGIAGHSSIIIKRITIPQMTEDELDISIRYEAEQYVPFDINDVDIDFQILGPSPDIEGQMDVILIAAKKAVVREYYDVVREAGLNPVIIDADAFALSNMFEVNYDGIPDRNIALINIGACITNINILRNKSPIFTRDIAIGGNHYTEILEKGMNISREDAERLKLGRAIEGIDPLDVQIAMNSASEEIISEIYRSFEFFRSSVSDEEITKIMISGGTSMAKGLLDMMRERLGMSVDMIDPFRKIKILEGLDSVYIRDVAPMAAVVVGLALRRPGDR